MLSKLKSQLSSTAQGDSGEDDSQSVPPASGDARQVIRTGSLLLAVGFGGFLLWAGLAPLDEGVPASGTVSIDSKRKAVQHLSGGILSQVMVREGQMVNAGDTLMVLDDNRIKAEHDALQEQYLALRAQESRLQAEQAGAVKVTFHPDLMSDKYSNVSASYRAVQEQLFSARRSALANEQAGFKEGLNGLEQELASLNALLEGKKSQFALLKEQLAGSRELAREGYLSRNALFDQERLLSETGSSVSDLTARISKNRNQSMELKLRALQRQQEYRKEVDAQLADTRRDAATTQDRLLAAETELGRTRIQAPAAGQVVGLTAQSVGAVVQGGQKIMDIVPLDEALIVEAMVPPHLVDRLAPNLLADVRFHGFVDLAQVVTEGKVLSISADLLTDPNTHQSYYLARVVITPEGMKKLAGRQMQSGMPVEVVIKTGERSFMTYLLKPLLKHFSSALTEH